MKPSSGDHETNIIPEFNLDLELSISGDDGIHMHQAKLQRKRKKSAARDDDGMFECKTCHLRFATFQALGGHRTSHMRGVGRKVARPADGGGVLHRCTVCGARFTMGQALGGHMRRHKVAGGWRKEERRREVEEFGVAPLVVNMFDVVRRSASSCQLLELFV